MIANPKAHCDGDRLSMRLLSRVHPKALFYKSMEDGINQPPQRRSPTLKPPRTIVMVVALHSCLTIYWDREGCVGRQKSIFFAKFAFLSTILSIFESSVGLASQGGSLKCDYCLAPSYHGRRASVNGYAMACSCKRENYPKSYQHLVQRPIQFQTFKLS